MTESRRGSNNFYEDFIKKSLFGSSSPFGRLKRANSIYKNSKKLRVEKNGEISRNLRFSLVFASVSKSFANDGRGRRARTHDPRFWRPVLYQLSYTPIFITCYCDLCIISHCFAFFKTFFKFFCNFENFFKIGVPRQ